MRNDFLVIRRAQVWQLACLLFIPMVTNTCQCMSQVSPLHVHKMGFLIPFLSKMCDLQSMYLSDHASQ